LTEYKGIKGGKVRNYSEDPENPFVGQVWYNETLGDLRIRKTNIGSSWSTGGNMNTGRRSLAGTGTQTAGLAMGGVTGSPAAVTSTGATELYDGTSWTSSPNSMNTARYSLAGAGTQTAALGFGGLTPSLTAATEEWSGTGSITRTITTT